MENYPESILTLRKVGAIQIFVSIYKIVSQIELLFGTILK
jgi:hypothetical protein